MVTAGIVCQRLIIKNAGRIKHVKMRFY